MAKSSLSFRVPEDVEDDILEIKEQEGISTKSKAAERVVRRGIERTRGKGPGEELAQQATGVAGVGAMVAAIGGFLGEPTAAALTIPFGVATFVFALVWASILTLSGRRLL